MEIVLPIQFTKKTNKTAQIDDDTVTVNNFFGNWFTDIDIRRYPDDMRILPTNNSVDIYQYSNAQLKYLPKKAALTFLKTFLYCNKPVYLDTDVDRRPNNDEQITDRSDPNLTERLDKLTDWIFFKKNYRIPLGLIVDLGLINFCVKTDTKFLITLERDMNKLFETNKKAASIPDEPDALIQFHDRPYIAYEEINLTKTMDIYLSGILRSEQALRMGVLPSPYQQEFEIATGTQSLTVTFKGAQRQFEWHEISLVYDKSYQHLTIYDSYDLELAAKLIKSVKFENTSTTYSLAGKLEYDVKKMTN